MWSIYIFGSFIDQKSDSHFLSICVCLSVCWQMSVFAWWLSSSARMINESHQSGRWFAVDVWKNRTKQKYCVCLDWSIKIYQRVRYSFSYALVPYIEREKSESFCQYLPPTSKLSHAMRRFSLYCPSFVTLRWTGEITIGGGRMRRKINQIYLWSQKVWFLLLH